MRNNTVSIIILSWCFLANLRFGLGVDHHEYQIDFDNPGERVKNFWYSTGELWENGEWICIHEWTWIKLIPDTVWTLYLFFPSGLSPMNNCDEASVGCQYLCLSLVRIPLNCPLIGTNWQLEPSYWSGKSYYHPTWSLISSISAVSQTTSSLRSLCAHQTGDEIISHILKFLRFYILTH